LLFNASPSELDRDTLDYNVVGI